MAVASTGELRSGDFGGGVIWFGEVAEVGGVVAEAAGLQYAHFSPLVGLEVSSAWDAQDAGQVGRAVDVPATIAGGVLEDNFCQPRHRRLIASRPSLVSKQAISLNSQ